MEASDAARISFFYDFSETLPVTKIMQSLPKKDRRKSIDQQSAFIDTSSNIFKKTVANLAQNTTKMPAKIILPQKCSCSSFYFQSNRMRLQTNTFAHKYAALLLFVLKKLKFIQRMPHAECLFGRQSAQKGRFLSKDA